jgi:hypothetical protein
MNHSLDVKKRAIRMSRAFSQAVTFKLRVLGKSFSWLAKKSNVSRANVSFHMSGKKPVTMTTMAKYEKALGVTWLIVAFSPEGEKTRGSPARRLRR